MFSRDDIPGLALAIVICEAVGAAPALVTATGPQSWYATLVKPALAPPNWVFGPVWTTLFFLIGVAVYLVLRDGRGNPRRVAFALFVAQYVLNVAWTLVFFGGENIAGGLVVITGLWALIAATILAFYRVSRTAALLLVPYLAWVSFAAVLNYELYRLN